MMPPVTALIRPEIRELLEYQPVPPAARVAPQLGLADQQIIKLDANENPYGAPPGVAAALAGIDPSRYPDAEARELRAALATYTGQPAERIVCGNGSDELLELLCRLFLRSGDAIITAEPTFGMYAIAARQHGAAVVNVARDPADFRLNVAEVLAAVTADTRLIFICAPNNPTGTPLPAADLRTLLEATPDAVVVLDEAYAEFAGTSFTAWLDDYPQLVVLRTLSKFAGLAGLRLGYAVCDPEIASALNKVRAPYNVNLAAQAAGVAALADLPWIDDKLARLRGERERLAAALAAIPGLHPYPSVANFLLVQVDDCQPAADRLYTGLLERGILIRRYTREPLLGCLRISVGTEAQNTILLAEIRRLWLT